VRTILWNNSSLHDCWETFTSNEVSSGFFSYINATGGFEGITTSSTMTESSLASTKTKGVAGTIWYLRSKGVDAFY
jgi:hypothetical protein